MTLGFGNFVGNARRILRIGRRVAARPREFLAKAELYINRAEAEPAFLQYRNGLPSIAPLTLAVDPVLSARPVLNVLLPGMSMRAMSGGPNTAINLVYRMAHQGVPVRFISTDIPMDQDHGPLRRHFATLTGLPADCPNVEICCGFDRSVPLLIGENDVFFASAWWNVQMIKKALELTRPKRFLYIIQDFEPGLYPWSTEYALALETYSLDYHAFLCGNFLADYMVKQEIGKFAKPGFIDECAIFEPAIDTTKFYPDPAAQADRPRRLVFYARPTIAKRNLFELGLYALRCAAMTGVFSGETWELLFIGEQVPSVDLGNGITIRSAPWLGFDDYAKLLRGSDIALSLMLSPHTSYPPVEMAACGGIAVTNVFANKTEAALAAVSPNIIAVAPTLECVIGGLREAVARVRDGRSYRGAIGLPPNWDATFADTVPRALRMYRDIQVAFGVETGDETASVLTAAGSR